MERDEIIQRLQTAGARDELAAAIRSAAEWLPANTPEGQDQDPELLAALWAAWSRVETLPVILPAGASAGDRVWAMPRPLRLRTLREMWDSGELSHEELRELVPDTWSDAEPSSEPAWWPLFKAAAPLVDDLPPGDPLTIYRGAQSHDVLGLAWSLDCSVAAWFALRFDETGQVIVGSVPRAKVAAYITNRDEAEVIAHPRSVTVAGREAVDRTDPDYLGRLEARTGGESATAGR